MDAMPLVKGKITFEEVAPPFTGATMYVRLENVTAADIASELVADYVERDVAFDQKRPARFRSSYAARAEQRYTTVADQTRLNAG